MNIALKQRGRGNGKKMKSNHQINSDVQNVRCPPLFAACYLRRYRYLQLIADEPNLQISCQSMKFDDHRNLWRYNLSISMVRDLSAFGVHSRNQQLRLICAMLENSRIFKVFIVSHFIQQGSLSHQHIF